MDNPFLLPSSARLVAWRDFRRTLPSLAEPDQLTAVAGFWAQAPLSARAYDVEAPSTWPTIWEMLHAGLWCRNSIAIGMEATLRLADWNPQRMQLRLILDRVRADMLLILQIDDAQLLNYNWGCVASSPETNPVTLRCWQWHGHGHGYADPSG